MTRNGLELFEGVLHQIGISTQTYTVGDLKRDMLGYLNGNLEYFKVSTHLVTILHCELNL